MPGCQASDEQGATLAATIRLYRSSQRRRHAEAAARTGRSGIGGVARRRIRQRQRRHIAQITLPILQLRRKVRAGHALALPDRIVGVADACHRRWYACAGQCLAIALRDILHQQGVGPAIADDMVHAKHQDMTSSCAAVQAREQQRRRAQVEHMARRLSQFFRQLPRTVQRFISQFEHRATLHDLHRLAVLLREARAQHRVPRDQRPQRRLQRIRVKVAIDLEGAHHVVGSQPRIELLQQPQLMLAVRQRRRHTRHGARADVPFPAAVRVQVQFRLILVQQ